MCLKTVRSVQGRHSRLSPDHVSWHAQLRVLR
jgi:hypothetical protein